MCWNCGCMILDNGHANPDNITTEKVRKSAKAGGNETIHKLLDNLLITYREKVMGNPSDVTPVTPDALYYREVYGREIQDINPNC